MFILCFMHIVNFVDLEMKEKFIYAYRHLRESTITRCVYQVESKNKYGDKSISGGFNFRCDIWPDRISNYWPRRYIATDRLVQLIDQSEAPIAYGKTLATLNRHSLPHIDELGTTPWLEFYQNITQNYLNRLCTQYTSG